MVWADAGYDAPVVWAAIDRAKLTLELVARPPGRKTFVVVRQRRVVERTFAWLGRLVRDFGATAKSSTAIMLIAMTGLIIRRFVHA